MCPADSKSDVAGSESGQIVEWGRSEDTRRARTSPPVSLMRTVYPQDYNGSVALIVAVRD